MVHSGRALPAHYHGYVQFRIPVVAMAMALANSNAAEPAHSFVIRDVTVVDVAGGTLEPHRDVYIRGEKITSVGPASKVPSKVRTVSGAGKYLIPGLWDMHVHLWDSDPRFQGFLANGVTGVRDMGSNFARVREWRREIERGAIAGPRIFTSGPPLAGVDDAPDPRISARLVRNAEEARRAFDDLDDMHVDFIEVLPGLRSEAFFALTEFTRHWGHRVAGNLPDSVNALQAVDARQGSIEDLEGILLSCSGDERDVRKQWREARREKDPAAIAKATQAMMDTYNKRKAAQLFTDMRIYEVLATPMLIARKRTFTAVGPEPDAPGMLARVEYQRLAQLLKDMADGGVGFLTGTDTGLPNAVAGLDLHVEMELMVEAGLTPAQVLRAASANPARALRHEADLGGIRAGNYADLVLLDANPLSDIANTRKIEGIFTNGRYLAKSELAAMLVPAGKHR